MKFGQLTKHKVRNNFPQNHAENEAGELFPDLFLFFEKLLYKAKQVVNTLVLIYFVRSRLRNSTKTNFITFQIVDPEICSILIFGRVWD